MWNTFIVDPMINALLFFYDILGKNFILALTVFTVLIRLLTLPLNVRQQRSMIRTQEMQPQIQGIQKKYKDNPAKMQEEFKRIGYNPADSLTGCLPTLIQFPILIGLYRAIIISLGSTPQSLFELVPRVYPMINLQQLVPIENVFLWLNLSQPDPFFILPVLVAATMFIQQKFLAPATPPKNSQDSNPAAAMTQSMQYTMPLMFGFFSLQFPSGLSIYFVLANLIGIAQGWYTRNIMAKEKALLDAETKVVTTTPNGTASSSKAIKAPTKSTSKQPSKSTSNGSSNGQATSKKRRSAKR